MSKCWQDMTDAELVTAFEQCLREEAITFHRDPKHYISGVWKKLKQCPENYHHQHIKTR